MQEQKQRLPFFTSLLQVVPAYYAQCSEMAQANFNKLGKALCFSVLVCGAVLAASFCEFWMGRNYLFFPVIFLGSGLFYYLLDQAIIMGDRHRNFSGYRKLRVLIALILGLFNSFLIDYYFFKEDILAARQAEVLTEKKAIADDYSYQINLKEGRRTILLEEIDTKEKHLSAQLDSLNAEANGMGGSGKKGIATIWQAKYRSYQADSLRSSALIESKQAEAEELNKAVAMLKKESEEKQAEIDATVSAGINKSLELLHRIVWLDGKFTNIFMSILILLVSMLLESVPLLAKDFYDVEEYFEVAAHRKEALLTNSSLRKQNFINKEATQLMNKNMREIIAENSAHKLAAMEQDLEHTKKVMLATETYMDELEAADNRWQEKYPSLYEQYGKPVMEKSYQTLSLAIEKVYS